MGDGLRPGPDGQPRCFWALGSAAYVDYHDQEWGRPTADDRWLFEKICLEGFQSGLSWQTILHKRENFRAAFDHFDVDRVAAYGEGDVARLMADAGIVRNRRKIEATIHNAGRARALRDELGSLAALFWRFEPDVSSRPKVMTLATLHTLVQTRESKALAKELKRRDWSFVGPTTMYAFMQAAGIVNDHLEGCTARPDCLQARRAFTPPSGIPTDR